MKFYPIYIYKWIVIAMAVGEQMLIREISGLDT